MIWARGLAQGVGVPANSGTSTDMLSNFENEYGAQLIGCTVMRMRMWVVLAGVEAAATEFAIVGARVIDDSEFATFDAPTMNPAVDAHADWFMYETLNGSKTQGHYIDVKSMRKFDELGQGLLLSLGNPTATALTDVAFTWSVLLALP